MSRTRTRHPRRVVPISDLETYLQEQLGYLSKSISEFDKGDISEFKRIALTIRVLMYDSNTSQSLASQLGIKDQPMISMGQPFNPDNLMPSLCLANITFENGGVGFSPALSGPYPPRLVNFNSWWNDIVLKDSNGTTMSRGDFILVVANQTGGAHVDAQIDERYHQLAKEFSIGIHVSDGTSQGASPLGHIEKVYIRHIGQEVLDTFSLALQRIVGNRVCACGSGRKARYCCHK